MNIFTPRKTSPLLFILVILLLTASVSAAEKGRSTGGEKETMEIIAHQKVNINTADTTRLTSLTGVGTQLAKRITEYRKQNGPFQKPEDIMQVKGVGQKVFNQNKDRIVLK
jgi:competence protein ComEA